MNVASLLARVGFTTDERPLESIKSSLDGIKQKLEILAAAEILRGVFELAEHYGHFAEQLGIAATSAGITVEALQKLQYSAGLAGIGAEEVSTGMAHLTRTLSEARKGSQEAVDAFAAVGISPAQVASFHTSQEALAAFSDGMRNIRDPIQRQALAFQVLGRGAVNMVEWVSQGSEAIRQQGVDADRLAAVIDGNTIESLRSMEDAMSSLFTTFRTFAATVIGYVAPSIRDFAKSLQQAFAANQAFIRTNFRVWAERLAFVLGFVYGIVLGLTQRFLDFAAAHPVLVNRVGGFVAALFILNGVLISLGAIALVFKAALGLISVGFGALIGPVSLAWGALNLFKGALSYIILGLGRLVTFLFPQVGAWITRIGLKLLFSPLGLVLLKLTAIAAIIFAIGAAGYTAWEMMFGHKKFEDTWLGGLMKKGGGILKSITGFLGIGGDEANTAQAEASPFMQNMQAMGESQDYLNERGGRGPLETTPQMQQQAAMADYQRIFNVSAPITVNVPAGSDGTAIAKNVSDVMKQNMDTWMRQSAAALNNGNRAM